MYPKGHSPPIISGVHRFSSSNAERTGIYPGNVGRLKRLREEISGQQSRHWSGDTDSQRTDRRDLNGRYSRTPQKIVLFLLKPMSLEPTNADGREAGHFQQFSNHQTWVRDHNFTCRQARCQSSEYAIPARFLWRAFISGKSHGDKWPTLMASLRRFPSFVEGSSCSDIFFRLMRWK